MTTSTRIPEPVMPTAAPWRVGTGPEAPDKGSKNQNAPYGYFYRDRQSTTFAFVNRSKGARAPQNLTPVGLDTLQALRDRLAAPEPPRLSGHHAKPEGIAAELCP